MHKIGDDSPQDKTVSTRTYRQKKIAGPGFGQGRKEDPLRTRSSKSRKRKGKLHFNLSEERCLQGTAGFPESEEDVDLVRGDCGLRAW